MVEITPSSYETVARLRREFFVDGCPAMEVKRLTLPDWLIEIEAWAVI